MGFLYQVSLVIAFPAILEIAWWFFIMVVAMARGQVSICPKCHSTHTRRSTRRVWDSFFPAFVRPRRCEDCDHRFFSLHSVRYTGRPRRRFII
jgi:hypothetical protein